MTGIFFLVIFTIVGIAWSIVDRDNREKRKYAWRQLAQTHSLHFTPDTSFFGQGGYVTGQYRGCSIQLATIQKSQGKSSVTYTRLTAIASLYDRRSAEQSLPALSEQEALNLFKLSYFKYPLNEQLKTESGGRTIFYEQRDIIQDTQFLEYLLELTTSLVRAYPLVANLGGEGVAALTNSLPAKPLQPLVTQLLRDIARNTAYGLAHRTAELLCPDCVTRFGPHAIDLPWEIDPIYYGCRRCGQSRRYLEGYVVATLDNQSKADPTQENGQIRVNWSARRELFDFDTVEILNATDEEVERFAMQVGNDTDELRQPRYKEITCLVNPQCGLSENSLRILRRMFGRVVIKT